MKTVTKIPLWAWLSLAPLTGATAESESIESQYLTNVRQVTRGMVKAGEGYFSPDASTIIYQAVPPEYPFYQIYIQPLVGGSPERVSTGRGRTTCAYFSPDGKKLLFASSHLDPEMSETEDEARRQQEEDRKTGRRRRYQWVFDPHMDIFEQDRDRRQLRRLTTAKGYDAEGAYSADGQWITFCSDRDGDADIYVMDSSGGQVRQLTNAPGYDGGPFLSPDGQWVVFRSDRKKEGHLQIYATGFDGSGEVALTDNEGVNWAPYWHPHKPYIIWAGVERHVRGVRPNYDLWLMRYEVADGRLSAGRVTRITDHPQADVLPVFSPDGKQLMWTSNRPSGASSQLWIADFRLPE